MFASSWLRQLHRRWFGRRVVGRSPVRRRVRLEVESLEARLPSSALTIAVNSSSDTPTYAPTETYTQLQQTGFANVTLRDALNAANNSGSSNSYVINLQAYTIYDLTKIDNYWYGPDGLPAIASTVTINGNGSTIQRD